MHELGVLCHAVKVVDRIASKNSIDKVKYITLEVGDASGYVPIFFERLFPVAVDQLPALKEAQLRIEVVEGKGLSVRDIGY